MCLLLCRQLRVASLIWQQTTYTEGGFDACLLFVFLSVFSANGSSTTAQCTAIADQHRRRACISRFTPGADVVSAGLAKLQLRRRPSLLTPSPKLRLFIAPESAQLQQLELRARGGATSGLASLARVADAGELYRRKAMSAASYASLKQLLLGTPNPNPSPAEGQSVWPSNRTAAILDGAAPSVAASSMHCKGQPQPLPRADGVRRYP